MNPLSSNYLSNVSFINQSKFNQNNHPTKIKRKTPNKVTIKEVETARRQEKYARIICCFNNQINRTQSFLQYTHDGYLFAYSKTNHILRGRSIIIFPQGIIANCNVSNNCLSGWIIICKKNIFYNISKFQKGKFEGQQYTYDITLGLTVQTFYKRGKIQSIKHGFADSHISFQKYIKNKEIINLLKETLNHQYFKDKYPVIQSQSGNFFGEIHNSMPRGIGILITQNQYFYGQFFNGLLDGYGTMLFENGDHNIGQFQSGMLKRYGIQMIKGSTSFKYNNQTINKIEESDYKKICSYKDTQLQQIFSPIIFFYLKLKEIYASRLLGSKSNQQESFVDLNLQNVQQDNEQITDRSSSLSNKSKFSHQNYSKVEIDMDLLKSNQNNHLFQQKESTNRFKNTQKQAIKKKIEIKKGEKPKRQEQNFIKSKPNKNRAILNDKQWTEVIQQLEEQQQYINRENGFLSPKKGKTEKQSKQSSILKKNHLNSNINLRNLKISQASVEQQQQSLQSRMIQKIKGLK